MDYKYYFYYLDDKYYSDLPVQKISDFYCYTDDEILAKEFESNRNMKHYMKVKKHITKAEVNELAKYLPKKTLKRTQFTTADELGGVQIVEIITTKEEEILCSSECTCSGYKILTGQFHENSTYVPVNIFKKDIRKALKLYKFDSCWNLYNYGDDKLLTNFMSGNDDVIGVDSLSIFVKMFGATLRGGD